MNKLIFTKNYIQNNKWRIIYALYFPIYIIWFFLIEHFITMSHPNIHIINTAIDDYIPFCEYFIIPYVLWFAYMAVSFIYFFFCGTNGEYIRFALSLIIGMSSCLLVCMIYPNGLTLRPSTVPDNIFGWMVSQIYASDTTTNVFPSIHVYVSVIIHIGIAKCSSLNNNSLIKTSSLILCILISLSTVFLKQHSVFDVLGGLVVTLIMYIILYVIDYNYIFKNKESFENKESATLSNDK